MQTPIDALTGRPPIPAMTTDAERECYYRLVRDHAHEGAVIEFGAWLGASTAYIAAAMRDAGAGKAHVYDKFQSKPLHAKKVEVFFQRRGMTPMVQGPCFEQFTANLGPLIEHVEVHKGQIEKMTWGKDRIAVMITDAPKRVPAISAAMTILRHGLQPGSIMAWQDFAHFPSYEIPACLYRLRDHLQFVEAVLPGTTLVFRVASQWGAGETSRDALSLERWEPDEIAAAWEYWRAFVPAEKHALFESGRAMFLCDRGYNGEAVEALTGSLDGDGDGAVLAKWRYLAENRPAFDKRYAPLFGHLRDKVLL